MLCVSRGERWVGESYENEGKEGVYCRAEYGGRGIEVEDLQRVECSMG
jgi:hypothetical protein